MDQLKFRSGMLMFSLIGKRVRVYDCNSVHNMKMPKQRDAPHMHYKKHREQIF